MYQFPDTNIVSRRDIFPRAIVPMDYPTPVPTLCTIGISLQVHHHDGAPVLVPILAAVTTYHCRSAIAVACPVMIPTLYTAGVYRAGPSSVEVPVLVPKLCAVGAYHRRPIISMCDPITRPHDALAW
jgi:hypothetical protein